MPNYGEQLLSKIIDTGDVQALTRFGIERDHFPTEGERKAYDFVRSYAEQNGGQAPSLVAYVGETHQNVTYIEGVTDEFPYIIRKIKESAGKRRIAELFNEKVAQQYVALPPDEFISWLTSEAAAISLSLRTNVLNAGKTMEDLSADFIEEYRKRKEGKSFKLWRTPFEALNEEIGGFYSGDIYGIMAESGRGKTYLSEVFIDEMLRQGAKVLVKSYEVKAYVWLARLISIMTARDGAMTHEDIAIKVGIPNKAILSGQLEGKVEKYFFQIVAAINEYYPGKLYLQAKSDESLTRTLADLDRELYANPDIDVVVIDPFYGLDDVYGKNANKTAGGAAEQAARQFERIIGKHDVVGIFTIQATTERQESDDDGQRDLRLPKRDRVKTTKAALEIVTNLFAFDAVNGNGRIGVEKGRNGGEGFTVELVALMDYGVLCELPRGEAVASQFDTAKF